MSSPQADFRSAAIAQPTPSGSEIPDLRTLTENWRHVARYSVYRSQGFASQRSEVKTILHTDQTYSQATEKAALAEEALRQEPGYRPSVMSRALIGMQLEKPAETRIAYLAHRRVEQNA